MFRQLAQATARATVRIAENTSIHGVKDLVRASKGVKIVWILVFASVVVSMTFQLGQVFSSYIRQEKGTSVTFGVQEEVLDMPSFYVCPPYWVNVTGAVENLEKFQRFQRLSFANQYRLAKEIVLDALFQPTLDDKRNYGKISYGIMMDYYHFEEILNEIITKSLPDLVRNPYESINSLPMAYDYVVILDQYVNFTKQVAVSAHGVCFELRPTTPTLPRDEAWKAKTKLMLLSPVSYAISPSRATEEMLSNFKIAVGPPGNKQLFYQNIAVPSKPAREYNMLSRDRYTMHEIEFALRKVSRMSTRASVCKNWSQMNQAKCNAENYRRSGKHTCVAYLPPTEQMKSNEFRSDTTCVYHRAGSKRLLDKYSGILESWNKTKKMLEKFIFSNTSLEETIGKLLEDSWRCPQPCATAEYQLQTREVEDTRFMQEFFNVYMRMREQEPIEHEMAAFFVNLIFKPDRGVEIREYPKTTLPVFLSDVGGTMGLYIGASVMSIVQLIYMTLCQQVFMRRLLLQFLSAIFRVFHRILVRAARIHGMKGLAAASRTAKTTWILAFIGSIVGMTFQMEQVFSSYVNQNKGTSFKIGIQDDLIEIPSFYICLPNWANTTAARVNEGAQDRLTTEILLDSLFQPTLDDKLNNDKIDYALKFFEKKFNDSLMQNLSHLSRYPLDKINSLPMAYDNVEILRQHMNFTKHVAVNGHGVCFELRPTEESLPLEESWKTKTTIMLSNRKLNRWANLDGPWIPKFKIALGPPRNTEVFYRNVAILSTSVDPWKVACKYGECDSYTTHEIQFFRHDVNQMDSNAKRCKPWSQKDQVKCNADDNKLSNNPNSCVSYLVSLQEIGSGMLKSGVKKSCVFYRAYPKGEPESYDTHYDYSSEEVLDDLRLKRFDHFQQLHIMESSGNFILSNATLEETMGELLKDGEGCPMPCESTEYQFQTSAVEDTLYSQILSDKLGDPSVDEFNVVVVDLILKPNLGVAIRERRTMTLTTFLSSIGGTIGLYLGASIISIVQLFLSAFSARGAEGTRYGGVSANRP